MYNQNSDQKSFGAPSSPRISFSNNLVESISNSKPHSSHHLTKNLRSHDGRDSPAASSDFEFSVVTNSAVMSGADELFSDGRLLPFKHASSRNRHGRNKTTLKDELLLEDEDEHDEEEAADFSLRPLKSSVKWKGFLGLRKSHIGSKKVNKNEEKTEDINGCTNNS